MVEEWSAVDNILINNWSLEQMERLYDVLLSLDEGLALNQEEDFTMKMY